MSQTPSELHDCADAVERIMELVSEAENVFWLMASLHEDRKCEGHLGLVAICSLSATALSLTLEREREALERLETYARKSRLKEAIS